MLETIESFNQLIRLTSIRSGSKTYEAVKLVIVDGLSVSESAKTVGIAQPTAQKPVKRTQHIQKLINDSVLKVAREAAYFREGTQGAVAADAYISGMERNEIVKVHGIARTVVNQACDRIDENEKIVRDYLKATSKEKQSQVNGDLDHG